MIDSPKPPAEKGFLGRWSDRKSQATKEENRQTESMVSGEISRDRDTSREPEGSENKPVLTDQDMPALESLDESSDYSGFLSPGVSDALRKAALRKLFNTPVCKALDGLNDYDDDYTHFEPLGDTITAEMSYRADLEAKRNAKNQALIHAQEENERCEFDEPMISGTDQPEPADGQTASDQSTLAETGSDEQEDLKSGRENES